MNRSWKVMLAFAGVFLCGAVFGGFLSLRLARAQVAGEGFNPKPPVNQFVPMLLRRYEARLELTQEQLEKIRPIVKATEEELRLMHRENFSRSMAVADAMNAKISDLLTQEQRDKLAAMKQEWRERWQSERNRRLRDRDQPPPPPGERPPPAP
jgi:Spy/CpxP family protein refolding chaperone